MFRNRVSLPPFVRSQARVLIKEKPLAFDQVSVAQPVVEDEEQGLSEETAQNVFSPSKSHEIAENSGGLGGEPALSFEATGERVWLVATRNALLVLPSDGELGAERIWWHQIDRAAWNPEQDLVKVSFTTARAQAFYLVDGKSARKLLAVLRERVESTVVISETIALTSAENVRVAVRRDEAGSLFVEALCDPGVDPTHKEVIRRVAPVVAKLREVSGAA